MAGEAGATSEDQLLPLLASFSHELRSCRKRVTCLAIRTYSGRSSCLARCAHRVSAVARSAIDSLNSTVREERNCLSVLALRIYVCVEIDVGVVMREGG